MAKKKAPTAHSAAAFPGRLGMIEHVDEDGGCDCFLPLHIRI
jgi:hypothetical protein